MKKIFILSVLRCCLFFIFSCTPSNVVVSVEEESLFSVEYGGFEDNLNLFSLSAPGNVATTIKMRDGLFYLANGESKKVMEFNSYGDLISVYYNEDINPTPSFAHTETDNSNITATRKAISYPFNEIGDIAVDSQRHLYVVDRLPVERQKFDENTRTVLGNIILRFGTDGSFIDYIGQQGPGGDPFPYIRNIYTTAKNELVVVCQTNKGMTVFWFNETGYLLYTLPFDFLMLPNPLKNQTDLEVFVSMGKIIPSYTERKLFVKLDYFTTTMDTATNVQSGIEYSATLLYPLDVETGVFDAPLTVPPYEEIVVDGFSKLVYPQAFEFLGATKTGWLFFIFANEKGYSLQMIQENGQKILTRQIEVDHNRHLFYSFDLSPEGILSVLFADKEKSSISWWRTDTLVDAILQG